MKSERDPGQEGRRSLGKKPQTGGQRGRQPAPCGRIPGGDAPEIPRRQGGEGQQRDVSLRKRHVTPPAHAREWQGNGQRPAPPSGKLPAPSAQHGQQGARAQEKGRARDRGRIGHPGDPHRQGGHPIGQRRFAQTGLLLKFRHHQVAAQRHVAGADQHSQLLLSRGGHPRGQRAAGQQRDHEEEERPTVRGRIGRHRHGTAGAPPNT